MYKVTELPVAPLLDKVPAELPLRVLLTVPEYVSSSLGPPLFNVPGAVSKLLGEHGLDLAERVISPSVWAPGLKNEQLREFITTPLAGSQWAFPEAEVERFRADEFPGRNDGILWVGFVWRVE